MLDSYGKIPSGVILGNLLWIGKYDECIDISASRSNNDSLKFHGLYCLAQWNVTLPEKVNLPIHEIPVKTGLCLPDSCHSLDFKDDIKDVMKLIYHLSFMKQYEGDLKLVSLKCIPNKIPLTSIAILFLSFLCIYLLLLFGGSAVTLIKHFGNAKDCSNLSKILFATSLGDSSNFAPISNESNNLYFLNAEKEPVGPKQACKNYEKAAFLKFLCILKFCLKFLRCFCVITNANQILNVKSSQKQFLCLHGLKFFSMAWVILGHTYVHNINYIDNYLDLLKGIDNIPFQVIMQGTFSVDTFFLIGGFLLGYLYLTEADKRNGKINWFSLCFLRFIRLTPVYAISIGLAMMMKYFVSGPFSEEPADVATCKTYWWWNILYINNFLPIQSMCLTWTWYLANDMQFFVLGTLILYILWRWRNAGIGILISLLIFSCSVTFYLSYSHNIPPIFMGISHVKNYTEYQGKLILAWDILYNKPYCRISSYLIGILLAYFSYVCAKETFHMKRSMWIFGWLLSMFLSTSVIFGLYHSPVDSLLLHLYNALARCCFSLSIAWVIFCCLTEHAGPVNKFLSYKLWIPLSRLTYCAYLFHPLIMNWYFQSQSVPMFFTHLNMVTLYFSFLLMSYGAAFAMSIVFEAPLINFTKILFKKS